MRDDAIEKACSLDFEPLSNESITAIVEKYKDDPNLINKMLDPDSDLDFHTKFISEHEEYVPIAATGLRAPGKLRCCHNLAMSKDPERAMKGTKVFLLIHGLGGTLEQFEPLMRLIDGEGRKFIALDLPGFGKSDEWDTYPMKAVTEAVQEAVSLLSTKYEKVSNVDLVGHSAGCYICIHFLTSFFGDYKISQLILLAPPKPVVNELSRQNTWSQFGLRAVARLPWILDIYRKYFDQCKGLSSSGIQRFFYRNGDITNEYRKLWQFHNNIRIKSQSLFKYLLGWAEIDWADVKSKILEDPNNEVSLLIICGDKDVVTPPSYSQDMLNHFSFLKDKCFVVVADCGHNVTFDYPEQLLRDLYDSLIN